MYGQIMILGGKLDIDPKAAFEIFIVLNKILLWLQVVTIH